MTMLKYRVASYEAGQKLKEAIKRRADENDFITLKEVDNVLCPSAPSDPDGENVGWRWSDLKGMNLYVRMCHFGEAVAQPYLYICEPTINIEKLTAGPEINMELIDPDNKCIYEMNPDGIRMTIPSEEAKDKAFLDYMFENMKEILANNRDNRRPVEVTHKKGNKTVVRKGYFHSWTQHYVYKIHEETWGSWVEVIDKDLAMIEFEDGHTERIDHKNFRFTDDICEEETNG